MTHASVRARSRRACLSLSAATLIWLAAAGSASAAGLSVDGSVKTHQSSASSSITSGAFSTTSGNDLLVAFIASDGPAPSGGQTISSVTGAGLTWKLAVRTNGQAGTAEIWTAVAPGSLSGVTVTATRSSGSYGGSIDVVAFSGADTTTSGAVGSASAATGAPSVALTTTSSGSWVWGVGDDYDNAISRTVPAGQTKFDEFLASTGDTYWAQSQTAPGNAANTKVTLNDTAPTTDRWDLSAIEIRPGVLDASPPTTPANVKATALNSNQVQVTWSPSTDNVGVTSYDVLRGGNVIGTAAGTTYLDDTVSPSTPYSYTVQARDAAGNVSAASDPPATVTTPPASASPPVISQVATSQVTTTSARVSWTTDIPSSTQVLYGTSSQYGQSTALDATQVTGHGQTLTGLTPGATYHFAVQSTGSQSNTATSTDNTFATMASNVTLPDMKILVPTSDISIANNPTTHDRQLQFTHITWDAGAGPFEIDPGYNAQTGTATWTQAIYAMNKPGVWTLDHKVPVAATGVFVPPSDYQFPLTKFTLNTVNADGSIGGVVATSPKNDYCITGDAFVGGVPNAPSSTTPPQSNCTDPTKPLGWSVGWGDEYDQTDNGQPIDLTGVADGTYILEGTVDPQHVLTESDPTNDVVDTKLQISGGNVAVLSQTNPGTTPPTVAMTSPADGTSVSGTVTLQASAAAGGSAAVTSVQFLLDGQPLGNPVTSAPYTLTWTVGSTPLGNHTLSARVTDSSGNVATATPITVTVVGGGGGGGSDTTPPTVSITNPTQNETVSATTPLAANASDNVAVASVQFFVDGQKAGSPVTSSPYAINWDTTTVSSGTHVVSAQATDTSGNVGSSQQVTVTVQNPAPPMTCFVMDARANARGAGKVTTPAFHTAAAGETLLAFVSADGPNKAAGQTVTVSGAGLTWTLVKRSNGQPGDSEVWKATAPAVLSSATVTSTPAKSGFDQDLTVIAMEGVQGVGASATGSAASGAPTLKLTTQGAPSLVFAVGHDYDNALARTLPANWTMLDQWVDTGTGDTGWTQYTSVPVSPAGSVVTVSDTAPTTDRWDLAAVELIGDGS